MTFTSFQMMRAKSAAQMVKCLVQEYFLPIVKGEMQINLLLLQPSLQRQIDINSS